MNVLGSFMLASFFPVDRSCASKQATDNSHIVKVLHLSAFPFPEVERADNVHIMKTKQVTLLRRTESLPSAAPRRYCVKRAAATGCAF
jgi:hypothetical protein